MPDIELKCSDCGTVFVFSDRDQQFFKSKNFATPKRCKSCRDIKKQSRPKQDQQR